MCISKDEKNVPRYKASKERLALIFGGIYEEGVRLNLLYTYASDNFEAL